MSKNILQSEPITNGSPYGSLEIGPDGKIYVAKSNSNYLGVINNPDLLGLACGYVDNGFYLGGQTGGIGLNNYIQYQGNCSNGIAESNLANEIAIFPNPTTDFVRLESNIQNTSILMHNSLGEAIYENKNPSREQQIDLSNHPAGVYFVRVKTNAQEKVLKLVKIDP